MSTRVTPTIAGSSDVEVGDATLCTERIVVATGSDQVIPSINRLAEAAFWTNREATTLTELPDSVMILGGGPVGIELGQFLRRFGVEVTLIHSHDRVISREEPEVGELIAEVLRAEGIELRLDARAESAARTNGHWSRETLRREEVSDGELLVATGRRARVDRLGLEAAGIEPGARRIEVDERCRAAPGVWAIGDVTRVMPFTHVGMYQARIVADDIAGREARASYDAIPRVVFPTPRLLPSG